MGLQDILINMAESKKYMLEWAVTPATIKRYRPNAQEFYEWCLKNDEDTNDVDQFDDLLLQFIHNLYEEGRGKSAASTTLYGILLYLPQLKSKNQNYQSHYKQ
jgi:hypothetical protein